MSAQTDPPLRITEGERQLESGFTLVELLVAIILVGILTAVAVVGLSGVTKTGTNSACATTLSAAKAAATTYFANTGAYPATPSPGFSALTTPSASSPVVFSLPSGVTVANNVMSASGWSVTMGGGGSSTPNTYTKTVGGGTPCT